MTKKKADKLRERYNAHLRDTYRKEFQAAEKARAARRTIIEQEHQVLSRDLDRLLNE